MIADVAPLLPIYGHLDRSEVLWSLGSVDEANPLLSRAHYLGPVRSGGRLIVIGQRDDSVVACQVWRLPTSRRLPSDGSWLELTRWCLTPDAGEHAGSRMHRYAVRLIRRVLGKLNALVSYSDPAHGHTGALYRACNWQWAPTWLRLRPPPTGNGAWTEGVTESVKDRWVFPMGRPADVWAPLKIDDLAAIRSWRSSHPAHEDRWAITHPQLASP